MAVLANVEQRCLVEFCCNAVGSSLDAVLLFSGVVVLWQDERLMNSRLPVKSYIWDITNPNTPEHEIMPSSPLCCLRFNPKVSRLGCLSVSQLLTYGLLRLPAWSRVVLSL